MATKKIQNPFASTDITATPLGGLSLPVPNVPTPQQTAIPMPQPQGMPNNQQGINVNTGQIVQVPNKFVGAAASNPVEQQVRAEMIQQEQAQNAAQLAGQIGATPSQAPLTPTPINMGQTIAEGTAGAIPSILTAVGTGAAIGAGVGAVPAAATAGLSIPAGAIIGGTLGLIKGVYSSVKSSISNQQSGTISAQKSVLSDGKSNLRRIVTLAKADPTNSERYVDAFNTQLSLINQAHAQLYLDTQQDLRKFTGKDATEQLQSFANFYSNGGGEQIYKQQMQIALMGGNVDQALLELQALQDETP